MKQLLTVIYEQLPGEGMNILRLEGPSRPSGVRETQTNLSKESFEELLAHAQGWKQIWDDGHIMVFEREAIGSHRAAYKR